jgi:hypothetical protein
LLRADERTSQIKDKRGLVFTLNPLRGSLYEDEIIEQAFIGRVSQKRDFWQDNNTTIDNDTSKRVTHEFRALPFQWAVINRVCLARIVEQSNVL